MPAVANLRAQFLGTIGMEFESEGKNRGVFNDYLVGRVRRRGGENIPFNVTRDASAESLVELARIGNTRRYMEIYTHNAIFERRFRSENRQAYGYELVTLPLTLDELEPLIYDVTHTMEKVGDFVTNRCAVHYHVGFAHNLRMMKRLLAMCLTLDPFLYLLGGMGRAHRGSSNLYAYARPLSNAVAVPVTRSQRRNDDEDDRDSRRNLGYVQVINPAEALQARDVNTFWANFGVFPEILGLNKYHPVRYTACNFYAIAMHGTMEFRHFNQSSDPALMFSIAKMLRAVVELSTVIGKNEVTEFMPVDCNTQITMEKSVEIVELMDKFFRVKEIEEAPNSGDWDIILSSMEKSSFKPLPANPVLTHNREFGIPANLVGNLIPVAKPLAPANVDIHNIKVSTILEG